MTATLAIFTSNDFMILRAFGLTRFYQGVSIMGSNLGFVNISGMEMIGS